MDSSLKKSQVYTKDGVSQYSFHSALLASREEKGEKILVYDFVSALHTRSCKQLNKKLREVWLEKTAHRKFCNFVGQRIYDRQTMWKASLKERRLVFQCQFSLILIHRAKHL